MHDLDDPEGDSLAHTLAARPGARQERATDADAEAPPARPPPLLTPTPTPPDTAEGGLTSEQEAVEHALLTEETLRVRGFSRIVMVLAGLVAVQLPWLGGDPTAQKAAGVGLFFIFALGLWGYLSAGASQAAPQRVLRIQGFGLATFILPVEYYGGFFSPMAVVLCLGIYHMAQASDRPSAAIAPLYVIATWLLGALCTTFGLLPDVGMFKASALTLPAKVFMTIGVTATLLAALWLSRRQRDNVRQAVLDANRAILDAQKREAVLQEAQHHLDHAMRMLVAKAGRHTGELAGTYQLGEMIGLGAMSEVYEARSTTSGDTAAVKLMHEEMLRREDHVARFVREAELCTRFDHPNIVRVHGVGRLSNGAPFMTMERLHGKTLSELLRERGQLSLSEVLELCGAIGSGLAHAHEKGVLHRDLKPSNMLAARGRSPGSERGSDVRWTLLDFGISRPLDSTGTLTGVEGVLGTPSYMSPEQARGRTLDRRSDLFSLASVLYRALTGRPAFPGKETPSIMFDVVYAMPEQPSLQVEGLDPDIDLVFAIALAKSRGRRFPSAAELLSALRQAEKGRLDEALRARGRALLAERPWGSKVDQDRERR